MLWGLEFVTDRATRAQFPQQKAFARDVRHAAQAMGLLTRGSAHVLMLAPMLTASREELDEIVGILDRAIVTVREASGRA